jgi:hypothetical protein
MEIVVRLTEDEIHAAYKAGRERDDLNKAAGAARKAGQPAYKSAGHNMLGCAGEVAFAKYLEAECSPLVVQNWKNSLDQDQGGYYYEVRTRSKEWHDLLLYPDEPYKKSYVPFVLVRQVESDHDSFIITGWCWGSEVPELGTLEVTRDKCWIVPREKLRPMDTLPRED